MKMNSMAVTMVCALAVLVLIAPGAVAEIVLTRDGRTDYRIVTPKDADVSTGAVAEDVAGILKEITGADFSVVTDDTENQECEIIVGADNARLVALGLSDAAQGFVRGEYEILTVGKKLVVLGGAGRGAVNGMYGLLQDHLGCRWFTPGCMKIPKQSVVALGEIGDRQKPSFASRATDPCIHWDAAWTARNRLNVCLTFGGTTSMNMLMSDDRVKTIANYYSAHRLTHIPRELFDTHPEYYAEIDGKRVCKEKGYQRSYCLTNEGFVEYVADMLKESFRAGMRFEGLGAADNGTICQCEACRASYKRLGLSGTYAEFCNKVADLVAKDYPDAVICALAYGNTYLPTKTKIKMHPNIRVTWCPLTCCGAHGLDECKPNRDRGYINQLAQWQANVSDMQIWYYHHQADALMPHLRMHATERDFKTFQRMGVESIFVEYNVGETIRNNPCPDGDKLLGAYGEDGRAGYFTVPYGLQHLTSYLVCRMLWDVNFDWKAGLHDFCDTYYGNAGAELAEYAVMTQSVDSYDKSFGRAYKSYTGVHQGNGSSPRPKLSILRRMNALFEQAAEKVIDDQTLRRRVEMARLSVDLAVLGFAPADDPLREGALVRFFESAQKLGLRRITNAPGAPGRKTIEELKEIMSHPETLSVPGEEP